MVDTTVSRETMKKLEIREQELREKGILAGPLFDTVDKMISLDYRDRFQAEYRQTKIRYEKLKNFCNRVEAATITCQPEPKHDCPLYLLRDQQKAMDNYLHILELRAIIEDISLGGEEA